jgi:hypothetical protein
MDKIEIEAENTLLSAFSKGINFFLGAGFSILAKDCEGQNLPMSDQLVEELKVKFNKNIDLDLSHLSTILERVNKDEFYNYLRKRFRVSDFPSEYYSLNKIEIKSIFTTNIDNLIPLIIKKNESKHLNDIGLQGPSLSMNSIKYSALHGCVEYDDRPLVFSTIDLSTTYSSSPNVWFQLTQAVDEYPTVFWGYSLNDSGTLQSLFPQNRLNRPINAKWIVLRKNSDGHEEYYKSLGFNIIRTDTKSFLEYLNNFKRETVEIHSSKDFSDINKIFTKEIIPANSHGLQVRPIKDFLEGAAPIWSDIFSKIITRTSHFEKIQDKIHTKKNILVLGIPASGKTTLLMQLAAFFNFNDGIKLIFFNPFEKERAKFFIKKLNKRKALIFIDNSADSIEAIQELSNYNNIQLVCFESGHTYRIVSHFIDDSKFLFHHITKLTDLDIQEIYNSIPESIRKPTLEKSKSRDYEDDSLFEFVNKNLNSPHIRERLSSVINELENQNVNLLEFLVTCCYVHSCRTPISFDMLFNYYSDFINSYKDIFDMKECLEGMISDYKGELIDDYDQDYYYPRSNIFSETILNLTPNYIMKRVLNKFLENVPNTTIYNYDIFKRRAYDRKIILKGFINWEEGKQFYEKAFEKDFQNPYVLQQGALYLSAKQRFTEAFHWIDRALNMSDDKYFSIRNSHAIILFDANIYATVFSPKVRIELDKSMEILRNCYKDDKRKVFHALRFADQSLAYYSKFPDEKGYEYMLEAKIKLQNAKKGTLDNEIIKKLYRIEKIVKK